MGRKMQGMIADLSPGFDEPGASCSGLLCTDVATLARIIHEDRRERS
jgi:hypothetical protein